MFLDIIKSMISLSAHKSFWAPYSGLCHLTQSIVLSLRLWQKWEKGLGTRKTELRREEAGHSPETWRQFQRLGGETDMDRIIQHLASFTYFLLYIKMKLLKRELQPIRLEVKVAWARGSFRIAYRTLKIPVLVPHLRKYDSNELPCGPWIRICEKPLPSTTTLPQWFQWATSVKQHQTRGNRDYN